GRSRPERPIWFAAAPDSRDGPRLGGRLWPDIDPPNAGPIRPAKNAEDLVAERGFERGSARLDCARGANRPWTGPKSPPVATWPGRLLPSRVDEGERRIREQRRHEDVVVGGVRNHRQRVAALRPALAHPPP